MPPKKAGKEVKGAANQLIDEDLTDAQHLPLLNDFIFTNIYSFKYRKNLDFIEKALLKEFFVSGETAETAELSRTKKVIQFSDLIAQAKAKQYLTDAEADDFKSLDAIKARQVLARTTNELLAGFEMPLRRAKLEDEEKFQTSIENMEEEKRQEALEQRQQELDEAALDKPEFQCWLKDFPKNFEDFQEMRRSAAQHQPEVETVIHAAFLIEEKIPVDFEEEDDYATPAVSTGGEEDPEDPEVKRKREQFDKQDRINARKYAIQLNRYAKNCATNTGMRQMVPVKMLFVGPDPPCERVEPDPEALEAAAKEAAANKKKGGDEVVPEVEKDPQAEKEDQMYEDFATQVGDEVLKISCQLNEFRKLTNPTTGIKKIPLYPRVLTLDQQHALDKQKKEAEDAAEEASKMNTATDAKTGTKPVSGKQKQSAKPAAGKPPPSQQSNRSGGGRPRTGTSVSEMEALRRANATNLAGVDDMPKNWNFSHYNKVTQEMKSGATSVGSILAAMIYQIEEENKSETNVVQIGGTSVIGADRLGLNTHHTMSVDPSVAKLAGSIGTMQDTEVQQETELKNELADDLDDMYKKMTMEHAVVETAFRHMFQQQIVNPSIKQSPYQSIINSQDDIKIRENSFTFLNGQKQGNYEQNTLKKMQIPGINERGDMPAKETRNKAERQADTAAIIKYCTLPESQTKRLITLKYFEDLVKKHNPERTYDFLDRNFIEHLEPSVFRQIMVDSMRRYVDINTEYYDKEDALLVALNFKNPPGRLLRRQWTYPFKVLPDFQTWSDSVSTGDCQMGKQSLYDIEPHKVGLLRTRQKYCFPCDDSVIRVDKNYVASRRFGSSVVVKDNLHFGIRERDCIINEKVVFEDELVNMDTRKDQDRRCEFWLEFENGMRMHAEMLDDPEIDTDLIPPLDNEHLKGGLGFTSNVQSNVTLVSPKANEDDVMSQVEKETRDDNKSILKSNPNLSSKPAGEIGVTDVAEDQKSLEENPDVQIEDEEERIHQANLAAVEASKKVYDPYDANKGSALTFTYKEGLVAKVLPNGDVTQHLIKNSKAAKKFAIIQEQAESSDKKEICRTVTRNGVVIRKLNDGTQTMYFQDGSITEMDTRRGLWKITNAEGIVRERNLRKKNAADQQRKLEFSTKRDAETNASIIVREDGLLKISYVDKKTVLVFPDHSKILITKEGQDEESATVTSTFSQEGYAPVKIINNPIKARASTIIGQGGTDALMGNANIMERSHGGLVSMLLLPDQTVVETYLEKQELKGINRFCRSLIHLVKRPDLGIIKVRQDGEIVIITSTERKYLNSIGNQLELGQDYDYFFELFGVPTERRSGVYTVDLDLGRLWTCDEEGNFFIVYANGDSVEKLSVSFNLDQMVEGIQNKEPGSPRIKDGEYIENECKFLPPPKTVAHPRLFMVNSEGAFEFSNQEMRDYELLCYKLDKDCIKKEDHTKMENEDCIKYKFMKQERPFNPTKPNHSAPDAFPKMPQSLEMVNETPSMSNDPESFRYYQRDITEFKQPTKQQFDNFREALVQKDTLRQEQADEKARLKVVNPQSLSDDEVANQCKIMLRIAKTRGISVQNLLGEEYKPIKQIEKDQLREAAMATLDDEFMPGTGSTQ